MWSTNAFLKRCEKLKELGLSPAFEKGMRIARGFADLGYEEFYCLSDRKLVSVFTGHISELVPEHRHFFFVIPSVDGLIDAILKHHYDIESLAFVDQRSWRVSVQHDKSGARLEAVDRELPCAIADALIMIASQSR